MASGVQPAEVLEKKFLSDHDCHPAPLRSELFDDARWKAHMGLLAADWALTRRTGPGHFVKAFADCESVLKDVKELLSAFADRERPLLPAAEWLLDNFFLIDAQIRNVSGQLTKQELIIGLPAAAPDGQHTHPRLNALLECIIRHSDGQVDQHLLKFVINAYQETASLELKELRATPVILTLVLLENIKRLAVRITLSNIKENLENPGERMRDKMSLRHHVRSLRMAGSANWDEYLRSVSVVDKIFCGDPAGLYDKMDFNTRAAYCKALEKMSRECGLTETEMAGRVIDNADQGNDLLTPGSRHIGYFLFDNGLKMLKTRATTRLMVYLALILIISILLPVALIGFPAGPFMKTISGWLAWGCLLVCSGQVALIITNWLSSTLAKPTLLPRLDYSRGVPSESLTLVAVPSMFSTEEEFQSLLDALEVRYLSAGISGIYFCLLTDFPDAAYEIDDAEQALLSAAEKKVICLNSRYGDDKCKSFFWLHRPRKWNPGESAWIGYERKRGKLTQLNDLLLGEDAGSFSHIVGSREILRNIKYVITLDTDTQLPRETAWKLIAAMAHPLNRPFYDASKGRVVSGYGILQPRIGAFIPEENESAYVQMQGNSVGIDPYTRASSDVYQDLFGEGSFIGKGIYDVALFNKVMKDRLPENRILSHDLIEGCYMRSGLISDVQLFEEGPFGYLPDTMRHYRWIRGDWQISSYLLPFRHSGTGQVPPARLSILSRWKIFDNLRRSIIPGASLLFLLLAWMNIRSPLRYTLIASGMIFAPFLVSILQIPLTKRPKLFSWRYWAHSSGAAFKSFVQALFSLTVLPYEAFYTLKAIGVTVWRMAITKKHLLQWNHTGSQVHRQVAGLPAHYRIMWICPATSVLLFMVIFRGYPGSLPVAIPFLAAWMLGPLIAWAVSLPATPQRQALNPSAELLLRKTARKTWRFFEEMTTANDHWLPPDHYQEHPVKRISHRTSPTNIGLYLLADLGAWDFGYIGTGACLERAGHTLQTLDKMQRWKGHFYNWYDTHDLKPIKPWYVSAVDSGNLAGHLIVFRQGLLEMIDAPIVAESVFKGLADTLHCAMEQAQDSQGFDRLNSAVEGMRGKPFGSVTQLKGRLEELLEMGESASSGLDPHGPRSEESYWISRFVRHCRETLQEIGLFLPWLESDTLDTAPGDWRPSLKNLSLRTLSGLDHGIEKDDPAVRRSAEAVRRSAEAARERIAAICQLADKCLELADADFGALYIPEQRLLSIGYNLEKNAMDQVCYDLLASEARLATYVGISQGKIPQESWFVLGRPLALIDGRYTAVSWSGSMFEYLMPLLVMPAYKNSILDLTCQSAVQGQIQYGRSRRVPWGISECAYNEIDVNLSYQYGAHGIPGFGLQRGREDDLVIAPYASMLALMIAPQEAAENLSGLAALGLGGRYGFFEAVDYTPARSSKGGKPETVQSFMAHHQGMGFLSILSILEDSPMQRRFESDPNFKTCLMLLWEQTDKATVYKAEGSSRKGIARQAGPASGAGSESGASPVSGKEAVEARDKSWSDSNPAGHPEIGLLSNGKYHLLLTDSGAGYSRWNDLALTRWQEDRSCDNQGLYCFLTDMEQGEISSSTFQPTCIRENRSQISFSGGSAGFRQQTLGIIVTTEVVVCPDTDMEIRRISLHNPNPIPKRLSVTSYAEVVIARPDDDAWHPAFSKLFIETEIVAPSRAIICRRRSRSADKQLPNLFHCFLVHGKNDASVFFETNRLDFIGRNQSLQSPACLEKGRSLIGAAGAVLDPIVSIQYQLELLPGETVLADLILGVCEDRDACMEMIMRCQQQQLFGHMRRLAAIHQAAILKKVKASGSESVLFGKLAGRFLFPSFGMQTNQEFALPLKPGVKPLQNYGIFCQSPVLLLRVTCTENLQLMEEIVRAHAYWRLNGLMTDLVIWIEDTSIYRSFLHDYILETVSAFEFEFIVASGKIHVFAADELPSSDKALMLSVARLVICDRDGTLAEQIGSWRSEPAEQLGFWRPEQSTEIGFYAEISRTRCSQKGEDLALPPLQFYNGTGGFSDDGTEYILAVGPDNSTPMPWSNIIANPNFGTVISESGQAYTWHENSQESRITPWFNDPVTDRSGEAYYIRDEADGYFWSPTALPACGASNYIVHHGFGYSVFTHQEAGIHSVMKVFVDASDAVKITSLQIRNLSGRGRRLSVFGYIEWVLGHLRSKTAGLIQLQADPEIGTVFAKNRFDEDFPGITGFFGLVEGMESFTTSRAEFLGRKGVLRYPAALDRVRLSGRIDTTDPCAALQGVVELKEGEETGFTFLLGAARTKEDAVRIIRKYRQGGEIQRSYQRVQKKWHKILHAVQVNTPDQAFNILANGWLLYQAIACRLWARSGYYQSGGAYGFRDQLQDVMAVMYAQPEIAREQILRCASRQFKEGDVQHWWHPASGHGVRTKCSDDYLWLPYVTCKYIAVTGDFGVLDECIPFLEGGVLGLGEGSYFGDFGPSVAKASLYEHCVRAIRHGLTFGTHGLPLMGSGDWNDSMDRVGIDGKGESIWVGFFLYAVLTGFSEVANEYGDSSFSDFCLSGANELRLNLECHGWDGEWYRRAYYDDGSVMGSGESQECKIDSICQSWAVLSGAAARNRRSIAMESAFRRLVCPESGLIKLFDPPFDQSSANPGYIKGYLPGVRENGGQYTHAAIWYVMALAQMGDNERAWELFDLINPISHSLTPHLAQIYKVEPYVVPADIYSAKGQEGRGGWTWYTGSAGWMYELLIGSILGLSKQSNVLVVSPCLPKHWERADITYQFGKTCYYLTIKNESPPEKHHQFDAPFRKFNTVLLTDDGEPHFNTVYGGRKPDGQPEEALSDMVAGA